MTGSPLSGSAFTLAGKTALITGGAAGIGLATARRFIEAGARVILLDRYPAAVGGAAADLGTSALAITADVTDAAQVDAAVDRAQQAFGGIDILVNSAGLSLREATLETDIDTWNRVVDVNMTALFIVSRAVARQMLAAGHGGAIINLASIMGLSGGSLYPNLSYHATKGAVVNMTRALAVEWGAQGIRVNAVAPTWVRTAFIGAMADDPDLMARIAATMPLGRIAEADEVALAILFLAGPGAAMITGHTLPVDGGFLAR
ncbi:MAG: SDR family oxidoreductase [Pararhodobacter sp.]|nr:SDR family oxidoreductase [Pararhodobacter sp.]